MYIDVVLYDLFGWEDHQFRFGQVQLKVVLFHPCGYFSKTVRDPRRDSGVLRRKGQKQLSIIGIAMRGKTMRADDRAQRSGVNGKEKWSHHRALGHACGEVVRYRQLTLPGHNERAPSEVRFKPGVRLARNAHTSQYGQKDAVVDYQTQLFLRPRSPT